MLINFCETKVAIDFYNKVETEFVESLKISDFFSFISIFLLVTHRKASKVLMHRASNYPDRVGDYFAKPFWRDRFSASLFETSRKV